MEGEEDFQNQDFGSILLSFFLKKKEKKSEFRMGKGEKPGFPKKP
jgi:hypothetical protein